jgi:hypothetical protein
LCVFVVVFLEKKLKFVCIKVNPEGTVPAIELPDGTAINESDVCSLFIEDAFSAEVVLFRCSTCLMFTPVCELISARFRLTRFLWGALPAFLAPPPSFLHVSDTWGFVAAQGVSLKPKDAGPHSMF